MVEPIQFPQRSARAHEPVRFEVSGGDPDSASRDVAAVYGAERWHARRIGSDFAYRYTAVGDTEVSIRRWQLRGAVRGSVPVGADYVVTWITSGTAHLDSGRVRMELHRDVPVLLPPEDDFVFTAEDHDQRLVHFGREYVQRVAFEHLSLDAVPLRFDLSSAPEADTAERWHEALVALSRALRAEGPDSGVWHEAKRSAATAFLDTFPPLADDLPAVLGAPRNARLRAAVEYIHAHAAEPVTVQELSEVAGLSVRSVQESFRRVFDVSPLTYLREVRLDRVRGELLELDPQAGVVGDVARRWGFAHLGRFSAAYAARFGEYPKQTLRR